MPVEESAIPEPVTTEEIQRALSTGTNAARFVTVMGTVLALTFCLLLAGTDFDPPADALAIFMLVGGFGYVVMITNYSSMWRFNGMRVTNTGFEPPVRRFSDALFRKTASEVRWETIEARFTSHKRLPEGREVSVVRLRTLGRRWIRIAEHWNPSVFRDLVAALDERGIPEENIPVDRSVVAGLGR